MTSPTYCRYSPNFSKRCTHLVVSAEQNDVTKLKLYLAGINKDKWHAQAVRFEWLLECANQCRQVSEDAFVVNTPKHEVRLLHGTCNMQDSFCQADWLDAGH